MISRAFIHQLYKASTIQRWFDQIRPVELTLLGKHAHAMTISWLYGKAAEGDGVDFSWLELIKAGVFDLLEATVIMDMKPMVKLALYENDEVKRQLATYSCHVLQPLLVDLEYPLYEEYQRYAKGEPAASEVDEMSRTIYRAASATATRWEFNLLDPLNSRFVEWEATTRTVREKLERFGAVTGVRRFMNEDDRTVRGFVDLCGGLRLQERWSQTPIIPKRPVLDHVIIVAVLAFLWSLENDCGKKRTSGNFFSALFHDLPESLTRDIIAPMKTISTEVDRCIKKVEHEQFLMRLRDNLNMNSEWIKELEYFCFDEFANRMIVNGIKTRVHEIGLGSDYDEACPVDGVMIRACDRLSAFLEACYSISFGVASKELIDAAKSLYEKRNDTSYARHTFAAIYEIVYSEIAPAIGRAGWSQTG